MTLVNLCVTDVVLASQRYLTPGTLGIFSVLPVARPMAWDRITFYVPQHAVSTGMYLVTALLCPWPACECVDGMQRTLTLKPCLVGRANGPPPTHPLSLVN